MARIELLKTHVVLVVHQVAATFLQIQHETEMPYWSTKADAQNWTESRLIIK